MKRLALIISSIAFSLLLLTSCATEIAPARSDTLTTQATAFTSTLVAKHSGKCLSVREGSFSNGASLEQATCSRSEAPEFEFVTIPDQANTYLIKNTRTGKCLDIFRAGTQNGADLIQYSCGEGANQHFELLEAGSGYYQLKAEHSGKCVDVYRAYQADGTNVTQYSCHSSATRFEKGNQLWKVNRLTAPSPSNVERLQVSSNHRYLQTASGAPLFILADTMWGLATLSESEADLYFKTRKEQGFNTILGPVAWGNNFITPAGDNLDSPKPADDPYYRHLDMLVAKAKAYGLYLGFVVQWGEVEQMSKYKNPQEAYDYGRFIGNRYKDEPHLFWFGSGEYTHADEDYADYFDAVSRGVKDAVGSKQLVSIHPGGGRGYTKQSSSYLFHKASWLDFNSIQTWKTDTSTFKKTKDDWNLSPTKPVFMAETKYEGEGSDAFRVRRLAYWSTFSGSLGFGYGHGDIWSGKRDGKDWQAALQAPGAKDMRHLADLVASRSKTPDGATIYFERRPDDGVVTRVDGGSNPNEATERGHVAALRDADGKYLMAYVPTNGSARSLAVDMGKLSGSKAKAWWYDPSSGDARDIGVYNTSGSQTFTTPSSSDDWVLVVDDASYGWGAPGR